MIYKATLNPEDRSAVPLPLLPETSTMVDGFMENVASRLERIACGPGKRPL